MSGDWFTKSKITTGDQVKTVRVAYSRSLETRAPQIVRDSEKPRKFAAMR